jgi:hypothetical protein
MSIRLPMRTMTPSRFRLGAGFAALVALSCVTAAACSANERAPAATQKSSASEKTTTDGKKIIVPESSRVKPGDTGKRAHTNYEILGTDRANTPPAPVGK